MKSFFAIDLFAGCGGMGWISLVAIKEILAVMPAGAIVWLVLGGLVFSAGAVVYITQIMNFKPGVFGFHESWHIFVILGCLCHFILILKYIAPVQGLM